LESGRGSFDHRGGLSRAERLWQLSLAGDRQLKSTPMAHPDDLLFAAAEKLKIAETHRRSRNYAEARRLCEEILASHPDYVAALQTLGLVLAEQNDHAGALAPLSKAVMLCPVDWKLLTALSATNLKLRNTSAAMIHLDVASKLNPGDPHILLLQGEAHRHERDYEAAAVALRQCLAADPTIGEAKRLLADCLGHMGESREAAALFGQMVSEGKAGITALSLLMDLPYRLIDFDVLAALNKIESRMTSPSAERTRYLAAFVRGWIFDGRANHAEAWDQLVLANGLKRRAGEYAADAANRDTLLATARSLDDNRVQAGNPGLPVSLFITGPSRAGKTTLERLVGLLPDARRGYENGIVEKAVRETTQLSGAITRGAINALPPSLDELFAERYTKALSQKAQGARLFTVTHPGGLKDVIRLSAAVPNCRFVFMRRRRDDLAFRIFQKSYKEGNAYAYDLGSIGEYIDWAFEYIELLHSRYPRTTLIVDYEGMIEDPRATLASVAALCGVALPEGDIARPGDDRGCSRPYLDRMHAFASPVRKAEG
jgi:tetratricopeptide (TPR) repeat protein